MGQPCAYGSGYNRPRELKACLTAIVEQVDALEPLAYDKNSYLVVPRVFAAGMMFPVVIAMATLVGITAGWLASLGLLKISSAEFARGLQEFYQFKDVWYGLVKAVSFGVVIALIGCRRGLTAAGGAEGKSL